MRLPAPMSSVKLMSKGSMILARLRPAGLCGGADEPGQHPLDRAHGLHAEPRHDEQQVIRTELVERRSDLGVYVAIELLQALRLTRLTIRTDVEWIGGAGRQEIVTGDVQSAVTHGEQAHIGETRPQGTRELAVHQVPARDP